jgi:hypothetical protein
MAARVTDLANYYISPNMQSQFPVLQDNKNYFRITIDFCRNCTRAILYSGFPVFLNAKYRPGHTKKLRLLDQNACGFLNRGLILGLDRRFFFTSKRQDGFGSPPSLLFNEESRLFPLV